MKKILYLDNFEKLFAVATVAFFVALFVLPLAALLPSAQDTIDEPLPACTIEEASEALEIWYNSGFSNDLAIAITDIDKALDETSTEDDIKLLYEKWLELNVYYLTEIEPNLPECHSVQMFNLATVKLLNNSFMIISATSISVVDDDPSWLDSVNPLIGLEAKYTVEFALRLIDLFDAADQTIDK